jgi:hypothetical protein
MSKGSEAKKCVACESLIVMVHCCRTFPSKYVRQEQASKCTITRVFLQADIADGDRPVSVRYFGRQPLKTFLPVQHML